MKACEKGNQKSFIPRAPWLYPLLSSTDVNEGDCQDWQIQGMKQAQRQGTDFTSEHLRFTPPFCLPLLIALEQQGRVQVQLSLKSDHDQLFQLAGEGTSMGTAVSAPWWGCALSSHTRWCPDVPGVTLLQSHSGHGQSPASIGIFSEAGHCSSGHVDTVWGGFMSSTDGWKQHEWCQSCLVLLLLEQWCTRFWDSWQVTASVPGCILCQEPLEVLSGTALTIPGT